MMPHGRGHPKTMKIQLVTDTQDVRLQKPCLREAAPVDVGRSARRHGHSILWVILKKRL